MRESDLLDHIARRSAGLGARFASVEVGPGDDCAVVRTSSGDRLLLTTDQLIVGRHVEASTPIDLIARKAIARSLSDIASMGGEARWALATGALPAGYTHADELFDAMARWALHWDCPLVGGDIAQTTGPLTLTVTVLGVPIAEPVLRSGAREGDVVCVTGRIGASFASGHHLRFEPRLREACDLVRVLGEDLHAMIDLSDGLGRDAGRVGVASGLTLEIDAARVPLRDPAQTWREALGEGEDYELLLCARHGAIPTFAHPIGRVIAGDQPGCVVVDAHGARHRANELGWDHGA